MMMMIMMMMMIDDDDDDDDDICFWLDNHTLPYSMFATYRPDFDS